MNTISFIMGMTSAALEIIGFHRAGLYLSKIAPNWGRHADGFDLVYSLVWQD